MRKLSIALSMFAALSSTSKPSKPMASWSWATVQQRRWHERKQYSRRTTPRAIDLHENVKAQHPEHEHAAVAS